jgi:hypothetical protein
LLSSQCGWRALLVAVTTTLVACGDNAPRAAIDEPTGVATTPTALPIGTGPFIDASMTQDEFEEILRKDGFSIDQLISQDAYVIDVGIDAPIVNRAETVGDPEPVELTGGYVIVDGVVVVQFLGSSKHCISPVGGSTTIADDHVVVELFTATQRGVEECPASSELWRATFVVPGAKRGMDVRSVDGKHVLGGVSPPLLENLSASLIYPNELPTV